MPKAVITYGPPGAGKGTQAELLARRFGFVHFDTGRYLENLFNSPAANRDPELKKEKENFVTGRLCTPAWILKTVSAAAAKIAHSGSSIVFSGSPRTVFEAFGDKKNKGLVALLSELYGPKNVFVVYLEIEAASSLKRNSNRLICSFCGLPALSQGQTRRSAAARRQCVFCAAPMKKRVLDDPAIIKVRWQEYKNRTYPILDLMKSKKIKVSKINGEQPPFKVSQKISSLLKLR